MAIDRSGTWWAGESFDGRVHARKVVHVHVEDTALTVYDGHAPIVAVPRHSSTDINRFRAKHQIRPAEGKMVP